MGVAFGAAPSAGVALGPAPRAGVAFGPSPCAGVTFGPAEKCSRACNRIIFCLCVF